MEVDIDKIIQMAKDFDCCPICGHIVDGKQVTNHYCEICKERFSEPENAYWFGKYLEQVFE